MKNTAAFFSNGGFPMLLGFVLLLMALGFAISSQPEIPWTVLFIVAGTTQFAGALGVQMRRIRRLENLLLAESPEARRFRRGQQLSDTDAESTLSCGSRESAMERNPAR